MKRSKKTKRKVVDAEWLLVITSPCTHSTGAYLSCTSCHLICSSRLLVLISTVYNVTMTLTSREKEWRMFYNPACFKTISSWKSEVLVLSLISVCRTTPTSWDNSDVIFSDRRNHSSLRRFIPHSFALLYDIVLLHVTVFCIITSFLSTRI